MKFTPEKINKLEANEVFVFGSNNKGIHGKGAAYDANKKFKYPWGLSEGLNNPPTCYALPTKSDTINILTLDQIQINVNRFIKVVKENPHITFLITPIGCGLAGFKPKDIAPMFRECMDLENVTLPKSFYDYLINR
jgi:hypothetical protein